MAINLISRELGKAKIFAEKFNCQASFGIAPNEILIVEPDGKSCLCECELPMRFQLPYQCWLYQCVVDSIPIPLSLIHPRWFYDGPAFVRFWKMSFNPTLTYQEICHLALFTEAEEQINQESMSSPKTPIIIEDDMVSGGDVEIKKDMIDLFPSGDRFSRSGLDLLEHTAYQSLDFHKTIQDSHRAEEYARDYSRIMAKLNKEWQDKELARASIPTSFPDPILSEKSDSRFKRGKGRRMTGRELAEKEEAL